MFEKGRHVSTLRICDFVGAVVNDLYMRFMCVPVFRAGDEPLEVCHNGFAELSGWRCLATAWLGFFRWARCIQWIDFD